MASVLFWNLCVYVNHICIETADCVYTVYVISCTQGDSSVLQTMDDQANWRHVQHSLDVLDFTQEQQKVFYSLSE